MRVEAEADARALRRVALLVWRAREDDDACRVELDEIAEVLERMKRSIALGTPLSGEDLREVVSRVRDLSCDEPRNGRLHDALISELRDLAHEITP